MDDPRTSLRRAARQLIETDLALGGEFPPAQWHPLPAPAVVPPGSAASAPPARAQPRADGGVPIGLTMTKQQKSSAMNEMDVNEVRPCVKCDLCRSRTQTVFGEGDVAARLVFVGEGPGQEEDRTGRPFVGRAGELLTKMIAAMGLTREQVYIANVVKCRPPGNRTPEPAEMVACLPYLIRQLQTIAPDVIVTMGNPATQSLLQTRAGITTLRGQWQSLPDLGEGLAGIAVMPTFHPAYLLRNYSVDARSKVWSDLQKVMDHLGMKTPDK